MNGRIYDPLLGRFLSADLVVQFPGSLQSYNRYSYVENNPLTRIDPTGWYSVLGLEFNNGGGVSGFFSDLGGYVADASSGAGQGAVAYGNGLNQGAIGAVVGTANAIADPIGAFKSTADGLGTLAARTIYDTKAVVAETKADLANPTKLGESFGNAVTAVAIGAGAAKAVTAVGEAASTAASTERIAATGTAEARVATATPETVTTSEVNPTTAPAAEAKGLGNPFKGKTMSEVKAGFEKQVEAGKLETKYTDPVSGSTSYKNTESGYSYNLDTGKSGKTGAQVEAAHVDVNRPNPKPKDLPPKKKLPIEGDEN